MRIFERAYVSVFCVAMMAAPALALDGSLTPSNAPATPVAAIGTVGTAPALKNAVPSAKALSALQYAAEGGHPVAQWKLGQMYANGDGVAQDDMRAFDYFSKIANAHAEDSPQAPQARIVANAFVQLGHYYRDGIPNSAIKSDVNRAREMYAYAASYFGDPDAQYSLAKLYLDGDGTARDLKYAARWLRLAATKGQYQAQALLGQMMFNGEALPRQAARGLMFLTLARDGAGPKEAWIGKLYDDAMRKASEDDRAMALQMLQRWVRGDRD